MAKPVWSFMPSSANDIIKILILNWNLRLMDYFFFVENHAVNALNKAAVLLNIYNWEINKRVEVIKVLCS